MIQSDFELKASNGENRVMREIFFNIDELADYIKKAPSNMFFIGDEGSKKISDPSDDFHDFTTWEDALHALEYGYNTNLDSLNEEMKKAKNFVFEKVKPISSSFKKDVVGFVPIVPNAIIGNPINMINQDTKFKKTPVCKIIIEKAMLGGVNKEDTIKYFSVFFTLLQLIESKGIRCELWLCGVSERNKEIHACKLKLKEAMQPINIYKLQFPIISADMFRRIIFRLKETTPTMREDWSWTYGRTLINQDRDYYGVNDQYKPNNGMQEILDIDENWVYIPNVQYAHMKGKSTKEIFNFFVNRTALKDYIKMSLKE